MTTRDELEEKGREIAAKVKRLSSHLDDQDIDFLLDIVHYAQRLKDLILYLARTYGDNDPVWQFQDMGTGIELPKNRELAETWFQVVRNKSAKAEAAGTDADGSN